MASKDRFRAESSRFSGDMHYREICGEGSLRIRGDLGIRLRREIERVQSKNSSWAEERLKVLRAERGEPLLDVLLVSEDGEVLNSISTYRSYVYNSQLALTIDDLARFAEESETFVYPLTGKNDTTLLWHNNNDSMVRAILARRFGDVVIEDYSVGASETGVSLARIKGGLMGKGKFADEGAIYGRLGFWENRLALGRHGAGTYVERARFNESSLLPFDTYVSPLDRDEVLKRGGIPMDSKQLAVNVVRVDARGTNGDFIVGALHGTLEFPHPVILGYSPLRPWKGEIPKHG